MWTNKQKAEEAKEIYASMCAKALLKALEVAKCTCLTCHFTSVEMTCSAAIYMATADAMAGKPAMLKEMKEFVSSLVKKYDNARAEDGK